MAGQGSDNQGMMEASRRTVRPTSVHSGNCQGPGSKDFIKDVCSRVLSGLGVLVWRAGNSCSAERKLGTLMLAPQEGPKQGPMQGRPGQSLHVCLWVAGRTMDSIRKVAGEMGLLMRWGTGEARQAGR